MVCTTLSPARTSLSGLPTLVSARSASSWTKTPAVASLSAGAAESAGNALVYGLQGAPVFLPGRSQRVANERLIFGG